MEDKDIQFKAHCLRELFKGRFTQDEMLRVLQEFDEDHRQALDFLIGEDPEQVSGFLRKTTNYIETLQEDSQHLLEFLDNSELVIRPSERLFACVTCNRSWWKKVPYRKEVSRCKKCLVRYDAIPKEREWGIGVFHCSRTPNCRTFKGWAVMGMTESICYICKTPVAVSEILSPKKSERAPSSKDTHQCNGFNCYNKNRVGAVASHVFSPTDQVPVCVHPKSRAAMPPGCCYLIWSVRHPSSGSTVSTFWDQGSLSSRSGIIPGY
ncbi:shiftless antiviral inhibitor of ribosomal frameshifting protein homolog isoform X1 [Biomphalaria glabrata]|uniref:Shiftless antiviral inhibitor of ribosomal frameshifting protein homolog isoform X1 n=1 Tax=Biomphalaria glabrata TaxID=6526 RepID=A0A9W2ZAU2_BIOGL|nr:shiftless antiviral inhibitor of ribosomal frameshifting protein homolog isoform X1 [Biomphalaria glabrata]